MGTRESERSRGSSAGGRAGLRGGRRRGRRPTAVRSRCTVGTACTSASVLCRRVLASTMPAPPAFSDGRGLVHAGAVAAVADHDPALRPRGVEAAGLAQPGGVGGGAGGCDVGAEHEAGGPHRLVGDHRAHERAAVAEPDRALEGVVGARRHGGDPRRDVPDGAGRGPGVAGRGGHEDAGGRRAEERALDGVVDAAAAGRPSSSGRRRRRRPPGRPRRPCRRWCSRPGSGPVRSSRPCRPRAAPRAPSPRWCRSAGRRPRRGRRGHPRPSTRRASRDRCRRGGRGTPRRRRSPRRTR